MVKARQAFLTYHMDPAGIMVPAWLLSTQLLYLWLVVVVSIQRSAHLTTQVSRQIQ